MELVVVMAILGIAIAAVVPATRRSASEDAAQAAATELYSLLSGARRLAVERSTPVTVILDPDSGRYWIVEGGVDSLVTGLLDLESDITLIAPEPRVHVRFEPDGPARADPLVLEARGVRLSLRIDRWTGEVGLAP